MNTSSFLILVFCLLATAQAYYTYYYYPNSYNYNNGYTYYYYPNNGYNYYYPNNGYTTYYYYGKK